MANAAAECEGVPITLPNAAHNRQKLHNSFHPQVAASPQVIGFTPRFEVGAQLGEGSYGVVNVCHEKAVLTRQLSRQPSYGASRLHLHPGAAAAVAAVDGTAAAAGNGAAKGAADGGGGGDSDEENGVERPEIVASVERVEATEAALLAARIAAEDVAGDAEGKQPPLPAKTAPEPPAAGKMYACKTVDKILNVEGGAATQKRLSARDIEVRVSALKHEIKVLKHVGYHPNIVKVVGVYNNEKRLRLVMELCDAGDLLGLLTNPPKKPQAEVNNGDNGASKEGDSNKGAAGNETKPEETRGKPFTKISQFFKGLAKGTTDPKTGLTAGAAKNGDNSSSSGSAQPEKMLQTGLSERQTALMFRQLVKAVEHCHSRQVIHRDIKLENVLLNHCCCCKCKPAGSDGGAQENGNQQQQQQGEPSTCSGYVVKLADFGLAKLLQPTQAMANGNKGSQLYKAPEVAQSRWYTTQADMWSLGVVLYALLSARFPPRDAQGMVAWEAVSDQRLLFKGGSWKEVSEEAKALVDEKEERSEGRLVGVGRSSGCIVARCLTTRGSRSTVDEGGEDEG
ncbi:unnamed protein product [Closterium sp. Naga37s-1]|nr:unnamed protein product [Closterium sp. Naga37s-1]CAI5523366.1 unnamed protein product [Closterium sp. Naga37s-1]